MADIAAFLTARLDEDEQWATAAADKPYIEAMGRVPGRSTAVVGHHNRHNPARVLREVAALRAIVELHSGAHECSTYDEIGGNCTWVPDGDCSTRRLVATIWADHPDYDEAWKP